jgi:hypothetical protein
VWDTIKGAAKLSACCFIYAKTVLLHPIVDIQMVKSGPTQYTISHRDRDDKRFGTCCAIKDTLKHVKEHLGVETRV